MELGTKVSIAKYIKIIRIMYFIKLYNFSEAKTFNVHLTMFFSEITVNT